jgi:hypothetical protein
MTWSTFKICGDGAAAGTARTTRRVFANPREMGRLEKYEAEPVRNADVHAAMMLR